MYVCMYQDFKFMYACMCYMCMFVHAGKISSPQDIELVLPRIGMLLSPGGYASLHLLYDRVRTKSHVHTYIHTAYAALLKLARITFMQ
jgi:hypothetical protein